MKSFIGLFVTLLGAGFFASKSMLNPETLNAGRILAVMFIFGCFYAGFLLFVKGQIEKGKNENP